MSGSRESVVVGQRDQSSESRRSDIVSSRLLLLLSLTAGSVDVIGFLSLKLFTAHITGNLVVIAALLVGGDKPSMDQILAVPVFMLAVAATWLVARALRQRGRPLAKPLLVFQFLLLVSALIFGVLSRPATSHGSMAGVTTMMAVSAMACQFALLRLAFPVAPSTAVMTGNLTNAVLSLLDTLSTSHGPMMQADKERLNKTLHLLGGFFVGCVAGAAGFLWMGEWAWSLPVALAGLAVFWR